MTNLGMDHYHCAVAQDRQRVIFWDLEREECRIAHQQRRIGRSPTPGVIDAGQTRLIGLPPPASLAPSAHRSACLPQILASLSLRYRFATEGGG